MAVADGDQLTTQGVNSLDRVEEHLQGDQSKLFALVR
jgi:hypothetical protein